MPLLKLRIHEIKRFAELGRAIFKRLLEEVSCAFQLLPAVPPNKLGQVNVPNLKSDREVEKLNPTFVHLKSAHPTAPTHLEALLKVLVLLQERGVVDDHLRIRNLQLHDLVVHRFRRFHRPNRLF